MKAAWWAGGALVAVASVLLATLAPMWGPLIAVSLLMSLAVFLAPKPALFAFGLFLLLQPALVNLAGGSNNPLGNALHRAHEAVAVAAAVRVLVFMGWERLPARMGAWVVLIGVFVLGGVLSGLQHSAPLFTIALGAFLSIKLPVFFMLALTIDWRRQDAALLVRGFLVLGLIFLVVGGIWLFLPQDAMSIFNEPGAAAEDFFARGDLRSMQAPFTHPGTFGWAMALIGCYAAASVVTEPSFLGQGALAAAVGGIIGSLRRKPLLALPMALLVGGFVVGSRRQRRILLVLPLLLVCGGWLFGRTRIEAAASDVVAGYLDPYAPTPARFLLYGVGWQIGKDDFPLGEGFGRYGGYASQLDYSPVYDEYGLSGIWGLSRDFPNYLQDTYWPHVLGETGFLGFLSMLAFLGLILVRVARVARRGEGAVRVLAIGAVMALVEAMVESAVWPAFEVTLAAYALAVPLGAILVMDAAGPEAQSTSARPAAG